MNSACRGFGFIIDCWACVCTSNGSTDDRLEPLDSFRKHVSHPRRKHPMLDDACRAAPRRNHTRGIFCVRRIAVHGRGRSSGAAAVLASFDPTLRGCRGSFRHLRNCGFGRIPPIQPVASARCSREIELKVTLKRDHVPPVACVHCFCCRTAVWRVQCGGQKCPSG